MVAFVNNMRIRARSGEYVAELDESDVSNAIWLSLPFTARLNMLGCQIYFEVPADVGSKDGTETVFDAGDVAYWPGARALCVFFGPTPLSGDDGKPVSRYPLIKIGRMVGEYSSMEDAGDRQPITLERSF